MAGAAQDALCDAHFHPQDARLDGVRDAWLEQTRAAGVARAVANGTGPDDWDAVERVCRVHPWIRPAYGLHPWKVHRAPSGWWDTLADRLQQAGVVCVGEIGLDRWIKDPQIDAQVEALKQQWELARRFNLPATVHCLRAWGPLLDCIQQWGPLDKGFLLHSYSGSEEMIPRWLDVGAWFSFSGYILHDRKEKARACLRKVPLDRLLVETDAPDMQPPKDYRFKEESAGDLQHPASLARFYPRAAQERGMTLSAFRTAMAQNFARFFGVSG